MSRPKPIFELALKETFESSKLNRFKIARVRHTALRNNKFRECFIFKCELCAFVCVETKEASQIKHLPQLKEHILKAHLLNEDDDINVVAVLINSIINRIEGVADADTDEEPILKFKCHYCIETHATRSELTKHFESSHAERHLQGLNSMKCLFCEEIFQQTGVNELLNHLNSLHNQQVIIAKSSAVNRDDNLIDSEKFNSFLVQQFEDPDSAEPSILSNIKHDYDESSTESFKIDSKSSKVSPTTEKAVAPVAARMWTCQMCKKQFDQRVDLSKHQCIELNLKILKKKKEMRKKKWREAHWKRKIDLSYIESTCLTQLSQNVADNLSFCVDGTHEDLKAYSREVKDYLNTELGKETQTQMVLKSLSLYEKIVPKQLQTSHHQNSQLIDLNVQKKADSYFLECLYNENTNTAKPPTNSLRSNNSTINTANTLLFQCKNCRAKCRKINELIEHQREFHGLNWQTTYDIYDNSSNKEQQAIDHGNKSVDSLSDNVYTTSPIGFLASDPFAYIINLYWDTELMQKQCLNCKTVLTRINYRKHLLQCNSSSENLATVKEEPKSIEFDRLGESSLPVKVDSDSEVCEQVIEFLIDQIEANQVVRPSGVHPGRPKKRAAPQQQDNDDFESKEVKKQSLLPSNDHLNYNLRGAPTKTKRLDSQVIKSSFF